MTIPFIFYKNMRNEENIKKLQVNYSYIDGYILFENSHYKDNIKIVNFYNTTLESILQKLASINNIQFEKEKYILNTIKAYDYNNRSYIGYIIY